MEDRVDSTGTPRAKLGRRGLIAGAFAAAVGAAVARVRPAGASHGEPHPLLLEERNEATRPTALTQHGEGPALEIDAADGPGIKLLSQRSALLAGSSEGTGVAAASGATYVAVLTETRAAGVAGFGELGVLGSSRLPAEAVMTVFPHGTGVAGTGSRFGVVGATSLPTSLAVITETGGAGVAGFGELGVLGSSRLPAEAVMTVFPHGTGVAGVGSRFGVVGATSLPINLAVVTETGGAGVAGFGPEFGIWGAAAPAMVVLSTSIDYSVGVGGAGDVGVWGNAGALQRAPHHPGGPVGLFGSASGPEAIAIVAENPDGLALAARGRAGFLGAGSGTVARREQTAEVANPAATADSLVQVTLMDDPGRNVSVHYAQALDGAVRVVLTGAPNQDTRFAFFLYESES